MKSTLTIKENRDFQRLYHKGKSAVSPVLVAYVLKNRLRATRYGITTGKKVGNAVRRSRARRVIRAAYSSLYPELGEGFDIVFVARAKTPYVKSTTVEKSMRDCLTKLGVISK